MKQNKTDHRRSATGYTSMDARGRILIPKKLRAYSGIRPGDELMIKAHKGSIMLSQPDDEINKFQSKERIDLRSSILTKKLDKAFVYTD